MEESAGRHSENLSEEVEVIKVIVRSHSSSFYDSPLEMANSEVGSYEADNNCLQSPVENMMIEETKELLHLEGKFLEIQPSKEQVRLLC